MLRIVCASEKSSEAPAKLKLLGNAMPAQGQQALTSLLNEFGDVMSNLLGNTTLAVHQIDNGTTPRIRFAPYRLCSLEGTGERKNQQSTCWWHHRIMQGALVLADCASAKAI